MAMEIAQKTPKNLYLYMFKLDTFTKLDFILLDGRSLKCNDGMEFHGFPAEIQEHLCDPGIQNCVKIFGSMELLNI